MERAGDPAWNPAVVIWALTPLAGATAPVPGRWPVLSTPEALEVVAQLRELDPGLVVLAGDAVCERPDLLCIVEQAVRAGLRLAVAPGRSPVSAATVGTLADAGVRRLVVDLDPADASGSPGRLVAAARDAGLPFEIDTTLTRRTVPALAGVAQAVAGLGPILWNVRLAVAWSGDQRDVEIGPAAAEGVFRFLYDWSERTGIAVATTAAPAYQRVIAQQEAWRRRPRRRFRPQARTLNDGHGLVFVSHTGDVYPSRELPLTTANVRETPLATVYRRSRLFRALRDPSRLGGKCGVCPFRASCGGSRARAWAATGDFLAADPSCAWQPALAPAA